MASPWQRFRRLSRLEQRMFVRGLVLLPLTACTLRVFRLQNVERLMDWRLRHAPSAPVDAAGNADTLKSVSRMVEAASRYGLVRGNCLSKSIVLMYFLRRSGVDAQLRVGGRKEGKAFEAHAWVELGTTPINDCPDVRQHFAPFEGRIRAH